MTWFILSLMTALAVASCDTGVKKWFSHLSHYEMVLFPLVYSAPVMAVGLVFVDIPPLDPLFYAVFAISLPLNMLPLILYMKAIKVSPLSLTVPYLAFTPVFMIGTGFLFLGEQVDRWGVAGILAVCAGSYILNISAGDTSFFDPLRAVFKETGSWLMLIVSFIFSLSAVIGKVAILHSSVMFFQFSFFAVLTLFMLITLYLAGLIRPAIFFQYPIKGAVTGALMMVHIVCHGFAISMTKAAYMMSIKRLSIVFGVIYGGLIFREENIRVRLAGSAVMFIGAAVILLMAG